MTDHTWESDADVDESVENVRAPLFTRLRRTRPRRRLLMGLGAGVAGLGLFAGGIAFGAAAYASPGRGTGTAVPPVSGSTSSALSISCYTSAGSKAPWSIQEYPAATDTASKLLLEAAKSNPAQTCVSPLNEQAELHAFGEQLQKGSVTGVDCGVLTATALPPLYFELSGGAFQRSGGLSSDAGPTGFAVILLDGHTSTEYIGSFSPPATPLPPSCVTITPPAIPTLNAGQLAACSVDAHHARVYVLGTETAAAVCEHHDESVWSR